MRRIGYSHAINEALHQVMELDKDVFVMGQGLKSPWNFGESTSGLSEKFSERAIDPPICENGMTGIAIGAAISGMKPIVMHPRMDFMHYAMDQIANHAANWSYMFGGKLNVPIVMRGIINRGGEQAAQHSQALQAIFAHIPGLKVVMPSNPYDAKGLLIAAVNDKNPVVYIDDRWLYDLRGSVPEQIYEVEIGKASIIKRGKDLSIIATSYMVQEALKAAEELKKERIDVEIVDIRTIKPIDKKTILDSVKKTGRVIIADGAWKTCGVAAEIAALISESECITNMKAPVIRVCQPDTPAPASTILEKEYFQDKEDIILAVKRIIKK